MITTASVHLDSNTSDVSMRCSVRRGDSGSITISDGKGGEVVLYVNADTVAQLAAAALEVMNAIDIASRVVLDEVSCCLCGARLMSGHFCRDTIGCNARAEAALAARGESMDGGQP